jgi:hypothetical protein
MPRQRNPKCPSCRRVKCKCEDMQGGFVGALSGAVRVGVSAATAAARAAAQRAAAAAAAAARAARAAPGAAVRAIRGAPGAIYRNPINSALTTAGIGAVTYDLISTNQRNRDQAATDAAVAAELEKAKTDAAAAEAKFAIDQAKAEAENARLLKESQDAIDRQNAAVDALEAETIRIAEDYEAWKASQAGASDEAIRRLLDGGPPPLTNPPAPPPVTYTPPYVPPTTAPPPVAPPPVTYTPPYVPPTTAPPGGRPGGRPGRRGGAKNEKAILKMLTGGSMIRTPVNNNKFGSPAGVPADAGTIRALNLKILYGPRAGESREQRLSDGSTTIFDMYGNIVSRTPGHSQPDPRLERMRLERERAAREEEARRKMAAGEMVMGMIPPPRTIEDPSQGSLEAAVAADNAKRMALEASMEANRGGEDAGPPYRAEVLMDGSSYILDRNNKVILVSKTRIDPMPHHGNFPRKPLEEQYKEGVARAEAAIKQLTENYARAAPQPSMQLPPVYITEPAVAPRPGPAIAPMLPMFGPMLTPHGRQPVRVSAVAPRPGPNLNPGGILGQLYNQGRTRRGGGKGEKAILKMLNAM